MSIKSTLVNNLIASQAAFEALQEDEEIVATFDEIVSTMVSVFRNGGRLYVAGNGGSASDANHLVAEFVGRYNKTRPPLAAESLNSDMSVLTCIANDFGYEYVFSRQLAAKMTDKDIFLAISTSGNSPNIVHALAYTEFSKFKSVLLTGRLGGAAKELADTSIIVPSEDTAIIQQAHIAVYHSLIEAVEKELFENA